MWFKRIFIWFFSIAVLSFSGISTGTTLASPPDSGVTVSNPDDDGYTYVRELRDHIWWIVIYDENGEKVGEFIDPDQ